MKNYLASLQEYAYRQTTSPEAQENMVNAVKNAFDDLDKYDQLDISQYMQSNQWELVLRKLGIVSE